jgi:hypothetical protein
VLHDGPGEADRIPCGADSGDGAGVAASAVHHRRVELVGALIGEDGAAPGVEMRVVLQDAGRPLDRVQGPAALGENPGAGGERAIERGADVAVLLRSRLPPLDHSGTAVDDELPGDLVGHSWLRSVRQRAGGNALSMGGGTGKAGDPSLRGA